MLTRLSDSSSLKIRGNSTRSDFSKADRPNAPDSDLDAAGKVSDVLGESESSEAASDGRTGVDGACTAPDAGEAEAAGDKFGESNLPATTSAMNDQRIVQSLKDSAAKDADERQGRLFDPDEAGDPEVARSLLDQLLADSKVYKTTESYKALLDFVVGLRNVAPFNAMLLQLQKPGLTYVASAHDWETRFHRRVKEDARPLLILWPFGPVATVYDVLDTFDPQNEDAEGLPENVASFFATGEITSKEMQSFKTPLERKRIELRWVDHGDASAGSIRVVRSGPNNKETSYLVKLNQSHPPAVQFTTLAHELGHLFLGHIGENTQLKIPKRRVMTHTEVEIEAESVAYLVCERNGVKAKSESYLSHFVKDGVKTDNLDLYQITRAAGQVETILKLTKHTKFQPSK